MIKTSYRICKYICLRKLTLPVILIAVIPFLTTGCCSTENARFTIHRDNVINPADNKLIAQFDALLPDKIALGLAAKDN